MSSVINVNGEVFEQIETKDKRDFYENEQEIFETFKSVPFMNDVRIVGFIATKPFVRKINGSDLMVIKIGIPNPVGKGLYFPEPRMMFAEVIVWDELANEIRNIYHVYDVVLIRGYLKIRTYSSKNVNGELSRKGVEYFINAYGISKLSKLTAKQRKIAEGTLVRREKYITNYETFMMDKLEDGSDVIYSVEHDDWLLM